jgi:hypothetical protein
MLVPSITTEEIVVFAAVLDASNWRARERGSFAPKVWPE